MSNNEPQGVNPAAIVGKLSNWKTYAIYGLLAVVAVEGIGLVWMRGSLAKANLDTTQAEAALRDMTVQRDIAKSNEQACRVNLDDQNSKIADASERYEDLQDEFDELEERIKNGDFYKPADDVRNQPTPKTCEEALDFLDRNFPHEN